MGYQIYPQVSASGEPTADITYVTLPTSNRYISTVDFSAGIYTLFATDGTGKGYVDFLNANNAVIGTASFQGTTPTIFTLSEDAKKIRSYADVYTAGQTGLTLMGSRQVGIQLQGLFNEGTTSLGTATVYTTSQAVSINGSAYVILIGGGAGGRNTYVNAGGYDFHGQGGMSGLILEKYATNWSGLYSITIGQGGGIGSAGGATTLTNAGGTVMSAGGGTVQGWSEIGSTSYMQPNETQYYPAKSGTYDYFGHSKAQPWQYTDTSPASPYANKFQWAYKIAVGAGQQGATAFNSSINNLDTALLLGNGNSGHATGADSARNATGYGNGGAGRRHNGGQAGTGSQGVAIVVTGVPEF